MNKAEQVARDLCISASAKQTPRGRTVVFQPGFSNPPKSGSLILLACGDRQSVAVTKKKSVGRGKGGVASEKVLEDLGCEARAIDVSVTFRAASFRDWLLAGPFRVRFPFPPKGGLG